MVAGNYDLKIEQGGSLGQVFNWTTSGGTAIDLTGCTARLYVKETYSSGTAILQLTNTNSKIVLGGALGTITLRLTPTETAALTAGTYVYDLEIGSGTSITRLLQGNCIISPEVTK